MALQQSDRVFVKYLQEHRNDGVDDDTCYYWFEADIERNEWENAKWIELEESFLSYGDALTNFLGSESVGRGLERLDIPNLWVKEDGIVALANNPAMTNLETLILGEIDATMSVLKVLVESPYLTNLKHLQLESHTITDEDVEAMLADNRTWEAMRLYRVTSHGHLGRLFSGTTFNQLKALTLSDCMISNEDLSALGQSTCISKVQNLALNGTVFSDSSLLGLRAIGALFTHHKTHKIKTLGCQQQEYEPSDNVFEDWPTLKSLRTLHIGWNELGPATIDHLLEHPVCSTLTELDLAETLANAKNMETLASSPQLAKLKTLNLWLNPDIGDAGAKALAQSTTLTKLKTLNMESCDLSFIGHRAITESNTLKLSKKGFTAGELISPPEADRLKGIQKIHFLLESGTLDGSDTLDLNGVEFDDDCVELLSTHSESKKVATLKLNRCKLTDDMLVKLLSKPSKLTTLKELYVDDNLLTHEIGARLESSKIVEKLNVLSICDNTLGYEAARAILWNGGWEYLYFEGNKSPEGDDIYDIIDDFWTSSIGDRIDMIDERR